MPTRPHRPVVRAAVTATAVLAAGLVATIAAAGPAAADTQQRFDDNVTSSASGTDYFAYPSNWNRGCCFSDLYAGDVHYAIGAGQAATFRFTGTEAVMYGVQDVDQGQAAYAVDGGTPRTVDHYRSSRVAQAALFDTGVLASGTHTVTVTPLGTKNAASTNTIVTTDSALVTGPVQPATFNVDLGTSTGAFRGGAAGTLYGQYQTGSPSQNLLDGFGAKTLATKAQDGQQHPGADALEVLPSFLAAGGRDEFIYATDVFRNFPYERTSIAQYQGYLKTEAQQVAASPNASHVVMIPFNEPDGNWYGGMLGNTTTLHDFENEWLQDVQLIKSVWPAARIAGPNTAGYDQNSFIDFLEFAKANNVLPDVVTWHTLGSQSGVDGTVSNYRNTVEPAAGVGPIPVDLDEYAAPVDLDNPAAMVPWISALEDNKVDGDLAYWRVDGTLADSVAQQNTPNAQWWLFNWYSQLTGNTVEVAGPNGNADGSPRGLATLDTARRTATMILSGGGQTGPEAARFTNVPSSVFGSTVHVTIQSDAWSGNTGAAAAPARVYDANVAVSNGSVTVPVDVAALTAYKITIAPGGGTTSPIENPWRTRYEAENATLSGSGYTINTESGDTTSNQQDVGGLRTGSSTVITFHTNVPATGAYTFRVFDGSNSHASDVSGPTNVYARVDGGAPVEIDLPTSYNWTIWNNVDTTLHLTAGAHDISLSTVGANGAATKGDAIIDCVDLIAAGPAATTYEAEQAKLTGTAPDYTARSQSGAAAVPLASGTSATFYVSAARDGYATLSPRVQGSGSSTLTVNGAGAGTVTSSSTTWTNPTRTIWLQQGVDKLVVAGTSGTVVLDDLAVTPVPATSSVSTANATTYQAEAGTLTGTARVDTGYTSAHGSTVTYIGPGTGNALTLTVNAAKAGTNVLTFRYANAQELPSNHYNPDLMVRTGTVSVNGGAPFTVAFGPTYSWNQFFTAGANVSLEAGANTVKIWSVQQYNWDGTTIGTVYSGDGGVGSQTRTVYAPNIDEVTVAPVVAG